MKFLKAILAAAIWLAPAAALAQSSPGWPFGYVPTAAEWNAAFAGKADFTGSSPITAAGGTFTGKVNFASSSAGTAGMNCGSGTAPSSPVNGDIWCTSTQMFVRLNGSSVQLGGSASTLTVPNGGTGQTSFTANLPLIGAGASALAQGTVTSTNGSTLFATASGTPGNGNCASWSNGNLVDAGVGACGGTGGSGTVSSSTINYIAVYTGATTISGVGGVNNGALITSNSGVPSVSQTLPSAVQGNITSVGTIASGTWQGTLLAGQYGGTGVANTGLTITLAGNLVTSGANSLTFTTIGATNVTLPTTGTLMNQNGTSGGIPYYNSSTTVQSSGALTANLPVFGGGAGASPFVGTRSGNTTQVMTATPGFSSTTDHCAAFDASGNIKDSGTACGSGAAAPILLATLTASASSSLTDVGNCGTGGSAGCFTNTYLNYRIDFTNIIATSPSTNLGCQIQWWNGTYQNSGYLTGGSTTTPTQYVPCWPVQSTSGGNTLGSPGASGTLYVFNPNPPSSPKKLQAQANFVVNIGASAAVGSVEANSIFNTAGAITGFQVCLGTSAGTCAGTIASGTIKIYGLP